ncbi:quinolinate synthetase A [Magnetococcus marinus MC-1]|uniref:Quinolinate synthase n=1 Tax=Magnetococcus marinus (strain ATCC BAA-1437 / JCM 17883 / MC-1) TaxID=156889 RepID=A0L842_MAGMM|nr:quinolinate synthase NadA [Magnetococcus marinus]ABK44135.1 quinolinate synthetase A [Magnetococcus marinus MC-1]
MTTANKVALDPLYQLTDAELDARIVAAKAALGNRCVILGHHYQREEVYRYADLTGDSLKLARLASQRPEADYILFCGVHFMAEVADILSAPHQTAILPDMAAGCSMADMADLPAVEDCWRQLNTLLDAEATLTPITYVNSAADLKGFCGEHGGTVCTSSNAAHVLKWAFGEREKVLFFPDQHLGRNTGAAMGIGLEEMVLWRPTEPMGGLTPAQIKAAKIILWDGFCSVHQLFQPAHIEQWRQRLPGVQVICHPECSFEVCQKADALGSTELIQSRVREAPAGSQFVIGTELNLVNRLKHEMPEKEIHFLSPTLCMCSTMFRIDPQHLLWSLENLIAGEVVNPIVVPAQQAAMAKVALERMLAIV